MGLFRKKSKGSVPPHTHEGTSAHGTAGGRIPPHVHPEGSPHTVVPVAPAREDVRFPRMRLKESTLTRRTFLARSLALVTAAIGGVLAAAGLGAIGAPALRKDANQWSPIGKPGAPVSGEPDLNTTNTPLLTSFTRLAQDAYMAARPEQVPVYVVNHGNNQFTIYDVRCTHLGCPIAWTDKSKTFNCPCHGGVFNENGDVVGGPPPKPLNRYSYKLEAGTLYAGPMMV